MDYIYYSRVAVGHSKCNWATWAWLKHEPDKYDDRIPPENWICPVCNCYGALIETEDGEGVHVPLGCMFIYEEYEE